MFQDKAWKTDLFNNFFSSNFVEITSKNIIIDPYLGVFLKESGALNYNSPMINLRCKYSAQ
jgi:hypothetical protein